MYRLLLVLLLVGTAVALPSTRGFKGKREAAQAAADLAQLVSRRGCIDRSAARVDAVHTGSRVRLLRGGHQVSVACL
jgi:hypothetical protein